MCFPNMLAHVLTDSFVQIQVVIMIRYCKTGKNTETWIHVFDVYKKGKISQSHFNLKNYKKLSLYQRIARIQNTYNTLRLQTWGMGKYGKTRNTQGYSMLLWEVVVYLFSAEKTEGNTSYFSKFWKPYVDSRIATIYFTDRHGYSGNCLNLLLLFLIKNFRVLHNSRAAA